MCVVFLFVFFFFKQKTAYELRISDWSSDVCSSDLPMPGRSSGHRYPEAMLCMWCRGCRSGASAVLAWSLGCHCCQGLEACGDGGARSVDALCLLEIGRASCRERVCQYV